MSSLSGIVGKHSEVDIALSEDREFFIGYTDKNGKQCSWKIDLGADGDDIKQELEDFCEDFMGEEG
jgi:hypothetical protein